MAVTLAESKNNAVQDYDPMVIDEFRKLSALFDALVFDDVVNPVGGGATLDYGYRRQVTQRAAAFRAYNTEYTPTEITTQKYGVTLAPLGGSFQVDRVLAKLGPAQSGAVALQLREVIKATGAKFTDTVINGDISVDSNSFDGLSKALVGSSTELGSAAVTNWSDFDTDARASFKVLDALDNLLAQLDGEPTLVIGNIKAIMQLRAAARRSSMYVEEPSTDLIGANGQKLTQWSYGGIRFVDAGAKAGSNSPIIPVETRTVGTAQTNLTDLYAVRIGLDGFHGVSTAGGQVIQTWLPDFTHAGAVKTGEVEMGPVAVALKATKAAAVLRNVKVA